MFNNFFDNYFYSFNRPMYERSGWMAVEKDGRVTIVVNALGVSPEDINITVENSETASNQILVLGGKTHNSILDKDFSISMKWNLYKGVREVVKSFDNGLVVLEVEFETPVKPSVLIRSK